MKLSIFLVPTFLIYSCTTGGRNISSKSNCVIDYDSLSNLIVYIYVNQMPEYQGRDQALIQYFAENIEHYNQERLQPTFNIEFIVDTHGKVIAPRIKGKVTSDLSEAEKEVLKVMEKTPKWNAGVCNDKNVPVKMFFPFKL